ncbi:hypothetical protein [Neptuniibacter sp.]|uniref:hypothetical protein n=1 Tax=Neptuniibacter sp. TaxID=1962643 RepID=UPI003B5AE3DF
MDIFFKASGLVVSVAGFIVIIIQLTNLDRSLKSSARGSIYDMASRIKEVFLSKPHLRKYFFDGIEISPEEELYDEVMSVADYYCLYLEQITTQKENIDNEERDSWLKYAHDIYHNSPVLREYLKDKRDWYSKKFWLVLEGDF